MSYILCDFAVFFFFVDGAPITNIKDCQQQLNIPKVKRYILMQQEHPRLHVPFLTFHPCKTAEIMEVFAKET